MIQCYYYTKVSKDFHHWIIRTHRPLFSTPFLYTKKGGWIDMSHFLFFAGRAYFYKNQKQGAKELIKKAHFSFMPPSVQYQIAKNSNLSPGGEAMQEGFIQERVDSHLVKHSAYSYEDLPSDKYGVSFALEYFDSSSNLTLAEQIANFLNIELGATAPSA
ncbi:MAG: hypothetical protein GY765_28460, partial [bacterium]|nr:hypothetical protein [bacterium]